MLAENTTNNIESFVEENWKIITPCDWIRNNLVVLRSGTIVCLHSIRVAKYTMTIYSNVMVINFTVPSEFATTIFIILCICLRLLFFFLYSFVLSVFNEVHHFRNNLLPFHLTKDRKEILLNFLDPTLFTLMFLLNNNDDIYHKL